MTEYKNYLRLLMLVMAGCLASGAAADDFYRGKTLTIIVGFEPGGGYDTYARVIARHIGKYIPGQPETQIQNMPGAGSLVAATYLYNKVKPDGLTLATWQNGLVLQQALGSKRVRFDSARFGWIGAASNGFPTCAVMGFSGFDSFADVLDSKRPIKMGAQRPGSTTNTIPTMLNRVLGTNFKLVQGYKGTSEIRLALQNREVEGACFTWESMRVTARAMLDATGEERLIPVITQGQADDEELAHLPRMRTLISDPQKRSWFDIWITSFEFQRPWVAPPDVPAERLQMLRDAFSATIRDTDFLADAERAGLFIAPLSGEETEQRVNAILALSEETKQALQFLIED